jgi:two-component system, response regulator PdtaR
MSQPVRPLRIAVADDERDMRQFFEELLPRLGHEVVVVAGNGQELVERCRSTRPDLVITDIKMPDLDGIDAAAAVNREQLVPVILVTGHHDTQLVARAGAEHIMAYLIKPVKPVELEATIPLAMVRFDHFLVLRAEAASLRQALEDRKLVERAKGVLMKRLRLDEPEAFRRLRRLASDKNRKVAELAKTILAADEIFQALE